MAGKTINIKVKVWRQGGKYPKGQFETYDLKDVGTDMSFLEMFDVLNEQFHKRDAGSIRA